MVPVMETSTKILLGGLGAVAVLLLLRERSALATDGSLAAAGAFQPPPRDALPPPFLALPLSQNPVSRTEDPPTNATVPPGAFIATFSGQFRLSNASDEQNGTAIGPVPVGTLLAEVTTRTSDALRGRLDPSVSSGGSHPVSWVSPDGERIAFTLGEAQASMLGIPKGLYIAHKA
jgi:hypothetical protein